MINIKALGPFAILLAVAACAENPVDRSLVLDGTRPAGYAADYGQCKSIAMGYRKEDLRKAAIGGGVVGGLIGGAEADDGDRAEGALAGAVVGALVVSAEQKTKLDEARREVIIRCMQGRGYRVIG